MKTKEIRNLYIEHMRSHAQYPHAVISSSLLVPENDPTTLFTGSGMQPMLPYLLGQKHPLGSRIVDSQKCFRSQDIEEVGDNRHTTFFEMLGNWSLGDYFKEGQIDMMWDFLIYKVKLNPQNLYISIHKGNQNLGLDMDTVAANKWIEKFEEYGKNNSSPENKIQDFENIKIGMSPEIDGMKAGERVFAYPDKKNWWSRAGVPENMPVGEPGGPDTEMFYDFDPLILNKKNENKNQELESFHKLNIHANSIYKNEPCHPNCDCGRFVEIGNNVFMQYKKTESGVEELDQKNVDFGGGLERIAAAENGDADVFNIDVYDDAKNILEKLSESNGNGMQKYISDLSITFTDIKSPTFAYRVILDHVRAATFLIGDGVMPGSKDQMYFVRRLIRRAVRYARNLNIHDNFMSQVAETFVDYYKDDYTNLSEKREIIKSELEKEESKFRKTLESGLKEFEKIKSENISGEQAFNLLQSFGFPIELTLEIAKEKNFKVDFEEFTKLKNAHAESSRTASAGKFKGGMGGDGMMEIKYHTATHMLHEALRQVLGEAVFQKGSNITSERLRFDFSYDTKMTDEEKKKVEEIVNAVISDNLPVIREEVTYQKARDMGAIGVFDDKYADVVSVYHVGSGDKNFSLEFCGGPHVESTGDMGTFKIIKEEAVSQGVRRIKATLS